VVKLRCSLAHIYYTIHHHSLKSAKNIITHCPKCCYSLSLQKDSMQKRHGLCKNMRGDKKGQVPGTSKKKEKKESETRGKNRQVFGVELGVQRYPPERKKWTSVRQ